MKVYLNKRFALYYPGANPTPAGLEPLLQAQRIQLREVQADGLGLSVAALAGYINTPPATRTFEGEPLKQSCIVFSGLSEEKLTRATEKLNNADFSVDLKAVLTNENRDWAFGALMQELEQENSRQENQQPEPEN